MSHHKKIFQEALFSWLPLAVAIIIMSGLVYVVAQQNYRLTANDPQIQIAQDIAAALNKYEGAMILVSHIPEFIKQIRIDEIIDLDK